MEMQRTLSTRHDFHPKAIKQLDVLKNSEMPLKTSYLTITKKEWVNRRESKWIIETIGV